MGEMPRSTWNLQNAKARLPTIGNGRGPGVEMFDPRGHGRAGGGGGGGSTSTPSKSSQEDDGWDRYPALDRDPVHQLNNDSFHFSTSREYGAPERRNSVTMDREVDVGVGAHPTDAPPIALAPNADEQQQQQPEYAQTERGAEMGPMSDVAVGPQIATETDPRVEHARHQVGSAQRAGESSNVPHAQSETGTHAPFIQNPPCGHHQHHPPNTSLTKDPGQTFAPPLVFRPASRPSKASNRSMRNGPETCEHGVPKCRSHHCHRHACKARPVLVPPNAACKPNPRRTRSRKPRDGTAQSAERTCGGGQAGRAGLQRDRPGLRRGWLSPPGTGQGQPNDSSGQIFLGVPCITETIARLLTTVILQYCCT